jgi:hypothetical protein
LTLPALTTFINTIAPPISSHERLCIHITHDLVGYPSLDPLIHSTFSRVMSQVEGGDLVVIQRGQEFSGRRASDAARGPSQGWNDGPWWRQSGQRRNLGTVKGLVEGTKLVRVSAEAYSSEYFASHGGLEQALHRATEDLSETNPVRSSDIFLAVQAISHAADGSLFQASAKETADLGTENADELVSFAIYLIDPVHSITFHTLSQAVPEQWIRWLDADSPVTPMSPTSPDTAVKSDPEKDALKAKDEAAMDPYVPEEITTILREGGVDPREWISEWIEECLAVATGVVAQRYVARRMGVGEGGLGKGRLPQEAVVGDGGGEMARAGVL